MADIERRRARAARLLAMALKAREEGQSKYADELTQLASDAMDETPPAQQQQQPQPKKE
jgi:hypothetical protein